MPDPAPFNALDNMILNPIVTFDPVLQKDIRRPIGSDRVPPIMKTCDKCHGAMLPERAVDLDAGLAITVFACLNCGRRKAADQEPRPITARH